MAEITPDLLEEFQKPAELAFEGRLIQPQAPPEPVFTERQGFFGNVPDIARRSSVASFLQWQKDNFSQSDDPNFDLKTYLDQNPDRQPYAHIFSDAKSQGYADNRWSRFKLNLEIDQRIADSEAFWSRMVTDIATDPLNLLPAAGLRRGVGIIEGIVRGAGASLPASAVDAAIRMKYDPNASFDDVKEQFLYTTAIMGVLGGGIGMLKPGRDVSGLAKDLIEESRRLAGDAPAGYKPKNPNDDSPLVLHTVPHDATGSYRPFEAQSTGDMPVGFASAYGLEKIAGQQSAFARLANAGYRATEDLANRLAGDYGVRFARAERFETPEPSASLAATKWSAEAGDAISKIRNAHARYLTGGTDSLEIAGINVRSTLAGVGDTFRGVFDRKRPDEKLTFQEFKEEIFKAHRADRIEHPIPEVEEAAKAIRPFFDNILQAQLKSGYIVNPEWAGKYKVRLVNEIDNTRKKIQKLNAAKMEIKTNLEGVKETAPINLLSSKDLEVELNRIKTRLSELQRSKALSEADNVVTPQGVSTKMQQDTVAIQAEIDRLNLELNALEPSISAEMQRDINVQKFQDMQDISKITKDWRDPENWDFIEQAAWQKGDWETLSELRKYTEKETSELKKYLKLYGIIEEKYGNEVAANLRDYHEFKVKQVDEPVVVKSKATQLTSNQEANMIILQRHYDLVNQELIGLNGYINAWSSASKVNNASTPYNTGVSVTFGMNNISVSKDKFVNAPKWDGRGFGDLNNPDEVLVIYRGEGGKYGSLHSNDWWTLDPKKAEQFGIGGTVRFELVTASDLVQNAKQAPSGIDEISIKQDALNRIRYTDKSTAFAKPIDGDISSLPEAANTNYQPYKGPEKFYLPRIFLPEQVTAKAETVRKTMIDWYSNPENYPSGIVPKRSEIVDRVNSEMNGMMKLGTMPGSSNSRPSFTRSRSVDIPNEVFADLGVIDLDISNVMQYYARRAGIGLEYSRAFGTPDANISISQTMLRVAEESKAGTVDDILKEIDNFKGEAENIRDIQLGTIFAENADSIGRRSSSLIRSWFAVTSMGGALMNSLMEMVRPAMVLGIRNNFDFALKALGNVESLKKMSDEQRTKLTAVHELAAGQTFRRFFDNGIDAGAAISRTSKMLEKVEGPLAYLARTPLYLLNGVGALTHYQKQFTGFLGSDMFAQRIMRVADNTASKDDALFLVDYGISLDDARKMATMPIEKDKGIMFANTAAWPDKDLADKFYQAVQALQDRVIITPSTADKPSIMMGILGKGTTRKEAAMLGLPFQLKSWGFAANNKILLSGLQGRDASLMSGVLMLFGAGYLVSSLKTPEAKWGNMSADEQILMGIEASGVLGLYGDLNFMIEQMSQDSIGLRPLMSMDPKRGKSDQYDALGEVFGPGPSKMLDIYKSFSSPYATSRDRANSVIRSIPFNNLIWIPQSFRALGRDTLENVL